MTTTAQRPPTAPARGMAWIPGGSFLMGSEDFYPEERPAHQVSVDGFWMDEHPVTVAAFRRFVKATGYVTVAERPVDARDYPGADPADLVPGALVFSMTRGPVDLDDWRRWWDYRPDASWHHPQGTNTTLNGRERHPVTQVAYEDARAYAEWAGKDLPTEAEWEFAARGGLDSAVFPWGDDFTPKGRRMANTWHGRFPWEYEPRGKTNPAPGTTPVGAYPPNGYGLYDVVGNVWEWTTAHFTSHHPAPDPAPAPAPSACCAPRNARVDTPREPAPDPVSSPMEPFPRRVIKGGSHLCAPNYCLRYRPAARQAQSEDTASCHLGFRCILR
ncbi:formylglycine-generating enzyme family protein [Streptomyces sp. NPDC001914]|uniref:formylglycine-generating enzyme family protein n=1 Tax=Streptomyces sp. NPDC001914 TaxID=3364623 RepID=UPI0036C3C4A0